MRTPAAPYLTGKLGSVRPEGRYLFPWPGRLLRCAGAGRRQGSWYRLRAVLPCGASAAPRPPGSPAHSPEMARSSEILRGRSAGSSAGGVSDRVLQAADGLLVGVGGLVGEHGVASGVGASLAEGLAQAMFMGLDADLVDGAGAEPRRRMPVRMRGTRFLGVCPVGRRGGPRKRSSAD